MSSRLIRQIVIITGLVLVLVSQTALTALADCPGNAAVNPSFEEGFSERGSGQVVVANGWTPYWQDGPDQDKGYNRRPEYGSEDGARYGTKRIHEGNWGQKWFSVYATHHGGVFQQLNVPQGATVTLSAWAQAWSSQQDDPDSSQGGQYSLSVGIDPTGGTDFESPNVVWSPQNGTLDQWVELTVQAKAQSGTVTVYLRGDAAYRVKHNDVYWDDVCVTYDAPAPQPTNTPKPTNTPTPTNTPEPTATPVPTEAPTQDPSADSDMPPTPVPAQIRVYAFDDVNDNGMRDADESLLGGAEITLSTIQRDEIESYTTTGQDEPYAFGGLQPGNYQVVEVDPEGYVSTSPNHWAVALSEGAIIDIYFADQAGDGTVSKPSATAKPKATIAPTTEAAEPTEVPPTVAPEPTPEIESGSIVGEAFRRVSGILVAMLALALPILYRVLRTRV